MTLYHSLPTPSQSQRADALTKIRAAVQRSGSAFKLPEELEESVAGEGLPFIFDDEGVAMDVFKHDGSVDPKAIEAIVHRNAEGDFEKPTAGSFPEPTTHQRAEAMTLIEANTQEALDKAGLTGLEIPPKLKEFILTQGQFPFVLDGEGRRQMVFNEDGSLNPAAQQAIIEHTVNGDFERFPNPMERVVHASAPGQPELSEVAQASQRLSGMYIPPEVLASFRQHMAAGDIIDITDTGGHHHVVDTQAINRMTPEERAEKANELAQLVNTNGIADIKTFDHSGHQTPLITSDARGPEARGNGRTT